MLMLIIQVVLIMLKCFKLIDWGWGLVFLPLWIDLFVVIMIKLKTWLDNSDSFY